MRTHFRYCTTCVIPNTRPNAYFNEEGRCSACVFRESLENTNFEFRIFELKNDLRQKARDSGVFQAVVGVSGGKDSTRQALWVREKLDIEPLLVSVAYPSRQQTSVGQENLANLVELGFETRVIRPAPAQARALFRGGLFRFGNAFKASEMALFSGPQRIALEENIPLVLWGENPALQVGDYATLGATIWDGNFLRNSNTLKGGSLDWFREEVSGDSNELEIYRFPSPHELESAGVNTVFLGPAWEDWGNTTNAAFSILNGFSVVDLDGVQRGDLYGTEMIDDDLQVTNFLLKYYKFGFNRGSEQASALLRQGEITRAEAAAIAEAQDGMIAPSLLEDFCEYARISLDEFWELVSLWGDSELFDFSVTPPRPLFKVGEGLKK